MREKPSGSSSGLLGVPSGQADIEKEVEATIWSENSNIANAHTSSSIWARKSRVGLRNPKRKTTLFEIHVTLVDGVAGLFFNGIYLLCGWRLLRCQHAGQADKRTDRPLFRLLQKMHRCCQGLNGITKK
jgi:hypothetical protein